MINEQLGIKGELRIVLTDKNGKVKEDRKETNLVVASGVSYIIDRMVSSDSGVMSFMGVGSDVVPAQAGDIALGAASSVRQALTSSEIVGPDSNQITYTCAFGAGVGTGIIAEAGIFAQEEAGTMLSRTSFPVVNKAADDSMIITWTITLSSL